MILPTIVAAAAALRPQQMRSRPVTLSLSTGTVAVNLPTCLYLTPESRRGWRGVAEDGEDPELWYDAKGMRIGPPRNYWRQAHDERVHTGCVELVTGLVSAGAVSALPAIEALESRMGMPKPLLVAETCMGARINNERQDVVWDACTVGVEGVRPHGPQRTSRAPLLRALCCGAVAVRRAAVRSSCAVLVTVTVAVLVRCVVLVAPRVLPCGPGPWRGPGPSWCGALVRCCIAAVLLRSCARRVAAIMCTACCCDHVHGVLPNGPRARVSRPPQAPLPGGGVPLGRVSLLNDYLLVQWHLT
jgi:hypothetical protein